MSRYYFENAETDMVGCFPGCCTVNNVLHMEGTYGCCEKPLGCIFSLLKRLGEKNRDRDKTRRRTKRTMRTTDK